MASVILTTITRIVEQREEQETVMSELLDSANKELLLRDKWIARLEWLLKNTAERLDDLGGVLDDRNFEGPTSGFCRATAKGIQATLSQKAGGEVGKK